MQHIFAHTGPYTEATRSMIYALIAIFYGAMLYGVVHTMHQLPRLRNEAQTVLWCLLGGLLLLQLCLPVLFARRFRGWLWVRYAGSALLLGLLVLLALLCFAAVWYTPVMPVVGMLLATGALFLEQRFFGGNTRRTWRGVVVLALLCIVLLPLLATLYPAHGSAITEINMFVLFTGWKPVGTALQLRLAQDLHRSHASPLAKA